MHDDIDIETIIKKFERNVIVFATLQRAIRFYVGAAVATLIVLSGYSGFGAFVGVAIVGLLYGYMSARASFNR